VPRTSVRIFINAPGHQPDTAMKWLNSIDQVCVGFRPCGLRDKVRQAPKAKAPTSARPSAFAKAMADKTSRPVLRWCNTVRLGRAVVPLTRGGCGTQPDPVHWVDTPWSVPSRGRAGSCRAAAHARQHKRSVVRPLGPVGRKTRRAQDSVYSFRLLRAGFEPFRVCANPTRLYRWANR
jgi:hypothetical protein